MTGLAVSPELGEMKLDGKKISSKLVFPALEKVTILFRMLSDRKKAARSHVPGVATTLRYPR